MFLIENGFLNFELVQINDAESFYVFINSLPETYFPYLSDNIIREKKYFMTQEIDDFLLQHFEDLGILYENGMLSKYEIEQSFGYYLEICWKNKAIQKYVKWKNVTDSDIYSKFRLICSKLYYS